MNVLLIYPCLIGDGIDSGENAAHSSEIFYTGALLKKHGHAVEIFDCRGMEKPIQNVERILEAKKPDMIGFSITNANRWTAINIAKAAKRLKQDVKIVFGGCVAASLWEQFLTHVEEIDAIVVGDAENPFLNLTRAFEDPEKKTLKKIKGVAYRENASDGRSKPVFTGPADSVENLDDLPVPAEYFTYDHPSLGRHCESSRRFCGSHESLNRETRFHSAGYFVHQLWLLRAKGVRFFRFSDENFTLRRDLVVQVCREILQRGLKIEWTAISNVDYVDEALLHWMRKAGCVQIDYVVESGAETIRKHFDQGPTREKIKRAFANTLKYGILARLRLLYGNPREALETLAESIELMDEIKPLGISSGILDILPGTAICEAHKPDAGETDNLRTDRIENISCFETGPAPSDPDFLDVGKTLRTHFHNFLSKYVDAVRLVDKKSLYVYHADFLSRLGMTFGMEDYSRIDEIRNSDEIAEKLFNKALDYYPDHRAFAGLGTLYQRQRKFVESIRVFMLGLRYYPYDEKLNIRLGASYMKLGLFESAEICFRGFPKNREARKYLEVCYGKLGEKGRKIG